MTEYVVLEKRTFNASPAGSAQPMSTDGWKKVDSIEASSAEAAVRKHVDAFSEEGGTFVAIPARSFQPIRVEVEQVSRVKVVAGSHAVEPKPTAKDAA